MQGEIERALGTLYDTPIRVHGSGRTDAGVHATGQVAHFDASDRFSLHWLRRAFFGMFPKDIAPAGVWITDPAFDARRTAERRSYRYHIVRDRNPLFRHYTWEYRAPLDVGLMSEATEHIVGALDATAFAAATRRGRNNAMTVERAVWTDKGGELIFEITANRFVHRFVRTVVGTMVEVGRGAMTPDQIPGILDSKDRSLAGPTAPPQGLFLTEVEYGPEWDVPCSRGGNDEVLYRHSESRRD